MMKGKIVEQGNHSLLLKNSNGTYSGMVNAQKITSSTQSREEEEAEDEEEFQKEQIRLARLKRATQRISTFGADKRASIATFMFNHKSEDEEGKKDRAPGIFKMLWKLAVFFPQWKLYIPGILGASVAGSVYPVFSILFGIAISNFAKCQQGKGIACEEPYRSSMISEGNQNALWFFLVSIGATIAIALQVFNLNLAANRLVEKLRKEMLAAYLRSDVGFFDDEKNTSGNLTNSLAEDTQKISSLIGGCLGTVIQSISTLLTGYVIALCYGWKL